MEENSEISFEQAMKRLEEIVQLLEGHEITLEESVRLYKEGAACSKICRMKLKQARHEIEMWQDEEENDFIADDEE